jgi:outer membrane immunogenic protein
LRRRQQLHRRRPRPCRLCRRSRAALHHRWRRLTNVKPSTGALPFGGGSEAGWTAGGGVEYAFTDNWTAKFEYLYASFQSATCNAGSYSAGNAALAGGFPGVAPATVSFHENIVRAGVNYKF